MPAVRDGDIKSLSLDARLQAAFRSGCVSFMVREVPAEIEVLIGAVPVDKFPAIRIAGTPHAVADAIRFGLSDIPFSPPRLAAWLSSDIRELVAAFASAAGVAFVGVQLAPAIDDRRFDRHGLGRRVVTSYYGSDGSWLRPRILAFLPPAWPVSAGVARQASQAQCEGRLVLSITTMADAEICHAAAVMRHFPC